MPKGNPLFISLQIDMAYQERIKAFSTLGEFFRVFTKSSENDPLIAQKKGWHSELEEAIDLAGHKNGWFTKENIHFALESWGHLLTAENLTNWLAPYDLKKNNHKTVALIMAGNIPLVGFHDFISVLLTGNRAVVKLASNDAVLLPFISRYLIHHEPSLEGEIVFSDGKLDHFEAVIATGSDNTSRYFEYYFGHKPHIIRKNRNSVAVLTGNESKEELSGLGEDIFRYYGLGCRSVSKLYVPNSYRFDTFFEAIYDYNPILNHAKYANNYDYNKAVYLMSEFKLLENGFLMLKEDSKYGSPIATLFYEEYQSLDHLKKRIEADKEKIQCVVSNGLFDDEIAFGLTQKPQLHDYADSIDTVEFLLKT